MKAGTATPPPFTLTSPCSAGFTDASLCGAPGAGAFLPHFTLGGLDTTVDGQVLSVQGDVISGLYAAGRTACGVPRRGDGYASGSSVGDATFSGRRAGRQAAIA